MDARFGPMQPNSLLIKLQREVIIVDIENQCNEQDQEYDYPHKNVPLSTVIFAVCSHEL
jgi:hypothetical protein